MSHQQLRSYGDWTREAQDRTCDPDLQGEWFIHQPWQLLYELKREWFKYCSMTHIAIAYAHVVYRLSNDWLNPPF